MNCKLLSIPAGLCLALQTACASAKTHDDSVAAAGSPAGAGRAGQAVGAGGMALALAAAGTFSLPDLMPMCAPVAAGDVVAACGGVQCPDLPDTESAGCTVTCCSTDEPVHTGLQHAPLRSEHSRRRTLTVIAPEDSSTQVA
jgi:hypothetical protein